MIQIKSLFVFQSDVSNRFLLALKPIELLNRSRYSNRFRTVRTVRPVRTVRTVRTVGTVWTVRTDRTVRTARTIWTSSNSSNFTCQVRSSSITSVHIPSIPLLRDRLPDNIEILEKLCFFFRSKNA